MGLGPTKEFHNQMNDNYVKGSLTCLKPSVIKKRMSTEFPLVINIEPTNNCNEHCYYCPRKETVQAQGLHYFPYESFCKVIDQIKENRLIMLNLHKDGESLLHKDLPKMVAYAKEKQAAEVIHLNTNGTLINAKTGRGIIENHIDDITISIDAATEETYQRLKKVKGLAKLEEDVKKALEYRNQINSPTKIRVKIMEFEGVSNEEIALFRERWTGIADEVQVTGVHNWSGAIKDLTITDEQTDKRFPCALLWYMLAINSNGKVSTCNVDWNYSGVVGDVYKESIKEIWNGKQIKLFRENHLKGIWNCPNICDGCVIWVSVGNMQDYLSSRKDFLS